jgi:HTH-type transcriptional regulator / antitoxin HigA
MADSDNAYRPDFATPPGETVKETIEALGITQVELARRMGRPLKTINEIINGKAMITPETALQLELVLGVPAVFWTNLERNYQLTNARLAEDQRLTAEIELVRRYPYADLVRYGCVRDTRKPLDRVRELLKFFGVNSLTSITSPEGAFRVAVKSRPSAESLAAWLRMGELASRDVPVRPYDASRLTNLLPELRMLTQDRQPTWASLLRDRCADSGVAVVFVPHLTRSYAHGATRWLTPSKALVQLSLRCGYADIFWFSFFHEIGHILKHGKREVFVDFDDRSASPKEAEADSFAAETLIPGDRYAGFARLGKFDPLSVRQFASLIGVHAGIVVGRLQRDRYLEHNMLNQLRVQLTWASGDSSRDAQNTQVGSEGRSR